MGPNVASHGSTFTDCPIVPVGLGKPRLDTTPREPEGRKATYLQFRTTENHLENEGRRDGWRPWDRANYRSHLRAFGESHHCGS